MDYEEVFDINDKYIILPKNKYESRENFLIRSYFIINNVDKNNNFEELVNDSYLYLNKNYLKCKFNKDIEKKLEKYLSS